MYILLRILHSSSRSYLPTTHLRPFCHSTTRMAESKTKSESEWRAILTPEQVRADAAAWPGNDVPRFVMDSSGLYVRKGQNPQGLVNSRTIAERASTRALAVRRLSTRATPSSRADVDGLRSLMVVFAVGPLWSVAYHGSQPFLVL